MRARVQLRLVIICCFLLILACRLDAQTLDRSHQVKASLGYSNVRGETLKFGVWTVGAAFRKSFGRFGIEPEFMYTRGGRSNEHSSNGLVKLAFDLTESGRTVPYVTGGIGIHTSASDWGLLPMFGFGVRITTNGGFFIAPEARIAIPYVEAAMPGFIVGLGYAF